MKCICRFTTQKIEMWSKWKLLVNLFKFIYCLLSPAVTKFSSIAVLLIERVSLFSGDCWMHCKGSGCKIPNKFCSLVTCLKKQNKFKNITGMLFMFVLWQHSHLAQSGWRIVVKGWVIWSMTQGLALGPVVYHVIVPWFEIKVWILLW